MAFVLTIQCNFIAKYAVSNMDTGRKVQIIKNTRKIIHIYIFKKCFWKYW